jgi:hypothetical protein
MSRITNNSKALAPISNGDANRQHIFNRKMKRIEVMRLITAMLKRKRLNDQKALSNIELYLDDWAFHHGTPITKANAAEAVADCVDRVLSLQQTKQEIAEQKEFEQLQGGLDDEPDFESAILKQQPELRKFKKV